MSVRLLLCVDGWFSYEFNFYSLETNANTNDYCGLLWSSYEIRTLLDTSIIVYYGNKIMGMGRTIMAGIAVVIAGMVVKGLMKKKKKRDQRLWIYGNIVFQSDLDNTFQYYLSKVTSLSITASLLLPASDTGLKIILRSYAP